MSADSPRSCAVKWHLALSWAAVGLWLCPRAWTLRAGASGGPRDRGHPSGSGWQLQACPAGSAGDGPKDTGNGVSARGLRVGLHPPGPRVGPPPSWTQSGPPTLLCSEWAPRVVSGPRAGGRQPCGQRGAAPACSVSACTRPGDGARSDMWSLLCVYVCPGCLRL